MLRQFHEILALIAYINIYDKVTLSNSCIVVGLDAQNLVHINLCPYIVIYV